MGKYGKCRIHCLFAFRRTVSAEQPVNRFHEPHHPRHPRLDRAFRAVFLTAETPDAVRKIEGGFAAGKLQGFRRAHLHADAAADAFRRVKDRIHDHQPV